MEQPDSSYAGSVHTNQLVKEMEALRNAAVRLSLALEDYLFFVQSTQSTDLSKAASAALERVKAMNNQ
jgi:hypothetical protein